MTVKEFTIEAKTQNIDAVTDFVNEVLEELGCPMKQMLEIDVAVDEIFANIASYAYAHLENEAASEIPTAAPSAPPAPDNAGDPKPGFATVRVERENDPAMAVIRFIDRGIPYDPLSTSDPDVSLSLEERAEGGLGVFLVRKMMDSMSYCYEDGRNILTIKKIIGK